MAPSSWGKWSLASEPPCSPHGLRAAARVHRPGALARMRPAGPRTASGNADIAPGPVRSPTPRRERGVGRGPAPRRRSRTRRVVRVLHGVYLRGDVVPSTRTKLQAAALVVGPHAVVCDRTAAWIWGVPCHDHAELDSVPPVETYVLRGHPPSDRPEVAGGTRDLMPCDWVEVEGVRVTTPIRTAMDLGCSLVRREALAGDGRRSCASTASRVGDLRRLLPRYFRRRGVVQLRAARPARRRPRRVVRASHGPGWRSSTMACRRRSCSGGSTSTGSRRTVSTWPTRMPASPWSTTARSSTRRSRDRERDLARRTWLREHGWTVIVLDRHSFAPDAVDAWVSELRDALAMAQQKPQRWFAR